MQKGPHMNFGEETPNIQQDLNEWIRAQATAQALLKQYEAQRKRNQQYANQSLTFNSHKNFNDKHGYKTKKR